ncbi:hypothetical protein [Neobittarella massiliensis]|uniref:hypothetical protein n=1 Tax=Neobittarella massiliensis (ex Bilen et al. 2018) TaxID=2041842 RepID=UPI000CF74A21|nr:hypothetical protein [Neobittarella massiliensis]
MRGGGALSVHLYPAAVARQTEEKMWGEDMPKCLKCGREYAGDSCPCCQRPAQWQEEEKEDRADGTGPLPEPAEETPRPGKVPVVQEVPADQVLLASEAAPRQKGRRNWLALGAALLAVLVLVLVAAMVLGLFRSSTSGKKSAAARPDTAATQNKEAETTADVPIKNGRFDVKPDQLRERMNSRLTGQKAVGKFTVQDTGGYTFFTAKLGGKVQLVLTCPEGESRISSIMTEMPIDGGDTRVYSGYLTALVQCMQPSTAQQDCPLVLQKLEEIGLGSGKAETASLQRSGILYLFTADREAKTLGVSLVPDTANTLVIEDTQ